MFERILLPLDGSRLAERILPRMTRMARQTGAELILIQAFVPKVQPVFEFAPAAESGRSHAEDYIAGKVEDLRLQGVKAHGSARLGDAAFTILDAAMDERATLIAMATHGRTGISRWALGSVAEKVLRASRVPVLTFRSFPGAPATEADRPIRRILLTLDGSDLARSIVPHLAATAKQFDARVIVLHVLEPDENRHLASESVQSVTAELVAEGVEGAMLVREGDPANEILETCTDQRIDLLAMTTHGRTGPTRWIFGSVTEKVLRAASVPLLVVRGSTVSAATAPAVVAAKEE